MKESGKPIRHRRKPIYTSVCIYALEDLLRAEGDVSKHHHSFQIIGRN